jgi:hypothetical protein
MHGGQRLSPRARARSRCAACHWPSARPPENSILAASRLHVRAASANPLCVIRGFCPRFCDLPPSCAAPGRQQEIAQILSPDPPFCLLRAAGIHAPDPAFRVAPVIINISSAYARGICATKHRHVRTGSSFFSEASRSVRSCSNFTFEDTKSERLIYYSQEAPWHCIRQNNLGLRCLVLHTTRSILRAAQLPDNSRSPSSGNICYEYLRSLHLSVAFLTLRSSLPQTPQTPQICCFSISWIRYPSIAPSQPRNHLPRNHSRIIAPCRQRIRRYIRWPSDSPPNHSPRSTE